ncbi:hypothetical protein NDU88_003405 [Pleurodeles waltl]|uniref:Uncharacterized protein n=1 Tax=Pleurodeles waltl TaxID=8319 RepID=A0AAV7KUP8_PLEWA|nr:hypothetical protein NDU88_003405 [Pleurodeles waltl]
MPCGNPCAFALASDAHALKALLNAEDSRTLSRDSTYDREKRLEGRRWRRIQRARPPVVIHVSRYATKTLNTHLMSYFVSWQRRRQETSESIPLRNEGVEYASYVLLRFLATETPGNE